MSLRQYMTRMGGRAFMLMSLAAIAGGCNEALTQQVSYDLTMTAARRVVRDAVDNEMNRQGNQTGYANENGATNPNYQSEEERRATADAVQGLIERKSLDKQQEQHQTADAVQGLIERNRMKKQYEQQQTADAVQGLIERNRMKKQAGH